MIRSCDNVRAPKGWKFQECTDEECRRGEECSIVLTRISRVGDWNVKPYDPPRILDSYAYIDEESARKEKWTPILYDFDLKSVVKGVSHKNISNAIRESVCLAELYNAGTPKKYKTLDPEARKVWMQCRKNYGISKEV